MKTFFLGLATAAVIAVLVGIGLYYADMSTANAQTAEGLRFLANG
jgi:hypothetical protein